MVSLALLCGVGATTGACDPSGSAAVSPASAEHVEKTLGAEGGEVKTSNGSGIEVPAGALDANVNLTVTEDPAAPAPAAAGTAVGTPITLGPEGQTFAVPVTVTLAVDASRLPRGKTLADVVVFTAPRGSTAFTALPTLVRGVQVAAETLHFSTFVPFILGPVDGGFDSPDGGEPISSSSGGESSSGEEGSSSSSSGESSSSSSGGPVGPDLDAGLLEGDADLGFDAADGDIGFDAGGWAPDAGTPEVVCRDEFQQTFIRRVCTRTATGVQELEEICTPSNWDDDLRWRRVVRNATTTGRIDASYDDVGGAHLSTDWTSPPISRLLTQCWIREEGVTTRTTSSGIMLGMGPACTSERWTVDGLYDTGESGGCSTGVVPVDMDENGFCVAAECDEGQEQAVEATCDRVQETLPPALRFSALTLARDGLCNAFLPFAEW